MNIILNIVTIIMRLCLRIKLLTKHSFYILEIDKRNISINRRKVHSFFEGFKNSLTEYLSRVEVIWLDRYWTTNYKVSFYFDLFFYLVQVLILLVIDFFPFKLYETYLYLKTPLHNWKHLNFNITNKAIRNNFNG